MTAAICIFAVWVGLMAWAVLGALHTPKPRQYPWLTNKKAPRTRG